MTMSMQQSGVKDRQYGSLLMFRVDAGARSYPVKVQVMLPSFAPDVGSYIKTTSCPRI